MEILSHRGLWETAAEKNTEAAFRRSFDRGFGTETDLRDHNGEIVIAHDMAQGGEMPFSAFLEIMDGRNLTLALNIKADGLGAEIKAILEDFGHSNYFVFDMSLPDLVRQIEDGLTVFTGLSDLQPHPPLLESSHGVWLDCFRSDWFGPGLIDALIAQKKRVCVVSADLHRRDVGIQWPIIKSAQSLNSEALLLCTDMPEKAKDAFEEAR
ncbi:phosphodiesterase [Martelella lutilitoris]|uniref:Phosphodiesterase n=1 Tax=Martelella lutilitoris TaxID=2583532 RepID=A0A7T7HK67_9HYPH|nr:phosphodiesterase [Martelella lutilitoris]QQM30627.1 phosphodiesterase [Martelella lutilitoris]